MNRRRLIFLLGLAVSWFLALGVRLYHVQVVRHGDYRARAEQQQNRVVTLRPPRGTIYDRRGHELAVSVEVRSVAADPTRIKDPAATARSLAGMLGLDAGKLAADLSSDRGFVWVRRKIDPQRAEEVSRLGLDGIFLVPENKRYYPLRRLAAQVIGFVGTDNQGLAGLEYLFEDVVAPELGRRRVVRDARLGTVLYPHVDSSEGRPGQDLFLTLDATIQHLVEHELTKAVRAHRAKRGMVVVMDPATGAVFAMASYPTFDPNRFSRSSKDRWRNRPIMDADEPGSTFKVITVAAALEAGAVEPQDMFDCGMGGIRFGSTLIKDHSRFGTLSVRQIIAKSSNVGAIKLGRSAGRQHFYDMIEAFGFGKPTGILLPSESPGIVRPLEQWSPLSPHYLAFGQGLSVTAIQLTNAFAVIANGGWRLKPFVVARIGRPGEPNFEQTESEVLEEPIRPSSVRQIRSMLEGVVLEGGTATAAAIAGYSVAGKTGTAQKPVPGGYSDTRHIASFVGFAPVRDPAVVVTVIIDEPRPRYHGGEVAAPVFKAITEKTLLYLGIAPERDRPELWPGQRTDASVRLAAHAPGTERQRPGGSAVPRPVSHRPTPEGTVPDFAGLSARQALARSSRLGIHLALDGHGAVARQAPAPGTPLEEVGGRVKLWLSWGEG